MATSGLAVRCWNGTEIARRQSDGYVNATAMCQANGKRWFDYERLERTQAYIAALHDHLCWIPENPTDFITPCLPAPELVISTTTGPNHLRGTWIHPRLAIDLARWISPSFAVWMDGWFLESLGSPSQPQQPANALPHGVHVVASNPREAAWLWAMAVECHVGAALTSAISRVPNDSYQLHLMP